jgi:hypothetical protein
LLSARNPRFKARAEKGELGGTAIFKIKSLELKYLDYAIGFGKAGIQELHLDETLVGESRVAPAW